MEQILICIDDTDDLESIGTGEVLENLCAAARRAGLAAGGFITRHQLLISERIAYTSHNSAMCCAAETARFPAFLDFARAFLAENCAPGSDPGLCVFLRGGDEREAAEALIAFGRRAQTEVLTKAEAYALAGRFPGRVWLSEHGGSGEGVIGALAGAGLRLTGSDGRVRGKLIPDVPGEEMTAAEFCRRWGVEQICADDGTRAQPDDTVRFEATAKAIFRDGRVTMPADFADGVWIPRPKGPGGGKGKGKGGGR